MPAESEELQLLRIIREDQLSIKTEQHSIAERMGVHEARSRYYEEIIARLLKAFPNEDIEGHCNAHELYIRRSQLVNEVLLTGLKKSCEAGIWLGLIWVAYTLLCALKVSFLKLP